MAWGGIGLYARLAPPEACTALALRAEYYDDQDGALSGTPQTLKEASDHRSPDGTALRTEKSQFLVLFGIVASF